MSTKAFYRGGSLLYGGTVPGVKVPDSVRKLVPKIFQACKKFGLDFYPTVVEFLRYEEMSEIASYNGFPVRYRHWKWGMSYEQMQKQYEFGLSRLYELVINTDPCYIFCMVSNSLVDNITVIAHALAHNDFFKNNIFFEPTDQENIMTTMANNAARIEKIMDRWGQERVMEFMDYALRIETLVDPYQFRKPPVYKSPSVRDERKYYQPRRFEVPNQHDYMDRWVNPQDWKDKEKERIKEQEAADQLGLFNKPDRDILGYLRDHAPLKTWQADILDMLREESLYFLPQRSTKILNEGWASWVDSKMMADEGLVLLAKEVEKEAGSIVDYADSKAGVLGGEWSVNPYKLGYELLRDIEDRWNKGRFGWEYEQCDNIKEKENWDQKLGLGKDKVFEVRRYYDDVTALMEFFTEDFCREKKFFEYRESPEGEQVVTGHDFKNIKRKLVNTYLNGGLPDIQLVDPNHKAQGYFLMQHNWTGNILDEKDTKATLAAIWTMWQRDVALASQDQNGEEIVYLATSSDEDNVAILTRDEYESSD